MMCKEQSLQPSLFYTNFNIDRRVRKDHPLRKIKKLIDFDFIYQEVKKGDMIYMQFTEELAIRVETPKK